MANPVLVEVSRGGRIESVHRGAVCVSDAHGDAVFSLGDISRPIFARSAIKAIQALPFVESGAADALKVSDAELALICSSHSGEDAHVQTARGLLGRAGLQESVLECGGHWSSQDWIMRQQTAHYSNSPPAICNNCSGKHSGFVCTAAHLGIEIAGYVKRDHLIQQMVRDFVGQVMRAVQAEENCGIDGCSIPTYAMPLSEMASGFARMVTGQGLSSARATAAKRLMSACMAQPFYVAGTGRFCTQLMKLGAGRIFAKTGAEGVFCGAIPELGLGIALKCDDGNSRASEAMMAAVVARLLPRDDPLQTKLSAMSTKPLNNWNAIHVGDIAARLP
ncbi:MAG: asparaginase [Ahrensia sp.]|nr:asparaginase [Ahrensia sp.]